MSLDPLKQCLYFEFVTLLNLDQNRLDQVTILDRLAVLGHPVVAPPIDKPHGHTVNRVSAVGEDCNIPMTRRDVNGS